MFRSSSCSPSSLYVCSLSVSSHRAILADGLAFPLQAMTYFVPHPAAAAAAAASAAAAAAAASAAAAAAASAAAID